jgi:hypothetical protein
MRVLRFIYLAVGIFLVGAGGFAAYASSLSLAEARASRHWPSVPGRITSTRTVMVPGRHGSSGPDIRYAYSVGGVRFDGSRLEVVTYSSNTSYASDAIAAFREGSEAPVYYDPAHPERSVLRPGANWLANGLPLFSAIVVLFGLALVGLFLRMGGTQSLG